MMPLKTSRRIPRRLKRDALGLPRTRAKGNKSSASASSSEPMPMLLLSPLELFFPIPESLLINNKREGQSNKKKVSFQADVQVKEIPSHRGQGGKQGSIWSPTVALGTIAEHDNSNSGEDQREWMMQDCGAAEDFSEDWTEGDDDDDLEDFVPVRHA